MIRNRNGCHAKSTKMVLYLLYPIVRVVSVAFASSSSLDDELSARGMSSSIIATSLLDVNERYCSQLLSQRVGFGPLLLRVSSVDRLTGRSFFTTIRTVAGSSGGGRRVAVFTVGRAAEGAGVWGLTFAAFPFTEIPFHSI